MPASGALDALHVTGGGFEVWAVAGVKIEY
jgi:hypothetical protein